MMPVSRFPLTICMTRRSPLLAAIRAAAAEAAEHRVEIQMVVVGHHDLLELSHTEGGLEAIEEYGVVGAENDDSIAWFALAGAGTSLKVIALPPCSTGRDRKLALEQARAVRDVAEAHADALDSALAELRPIRVGPR
jgi:hypothetical protein